MKKTVSTLLGGLGAGYLVVLIWEMIIGNGTITVPAHKVEVMDHWSFLIILAWCLSSVCAAVYLWENSDG